MKIEDTNTLAAHSDTSLSLLFQMDFQESNLARLLLAAGLPSQVHSRLGSGSSSSPCTPSMQRAHPSHVNIQTHTEAFQTHYHSFFLIYFFIYLFYHF